MTPRRPIGAGAFPIEVERLAPDTPDPATLYAALDLGTNSCRMLIAQPKGSQFHVVDSFSKSVQLGLGLEASGRLSRASMNRTVSAMRICKQKLERHNVKHMRLVATEACRRATNAGSLIAQVERETGLKLEIIQPEEEARLAVISCAPLVSKQDRTAAGGRYRRRLDRAGLDRPQPRAPPRAPARHHAAASGLPSGSGAVCRRQGGGLDLGAAGGGDAARAVCRCRRTIRRASR